MKDLQPYQPAFLAGPCECCGAPSPWSRLCLTCHLLLPEWLLEQLTTPIDNLEAAAHLHRVYLAHLCRLRHEARQASLN